MLQAKELLLKAGTVVHATMITVHGSSTNESAQRDPETVSGEGMRPRTAKQGSQWCVGMKAHIGDDTDSGPVHTVEGMPVSVNDLVEANSLLQGQETHDFANAGYWGVANRTNAREDVRWCVCIRPAKHRTLDKTRKVAALVEQLERPKASIRAKVKHPSRVIKRQFGYVKVRYRWLKEDTAQFRTLIAVSNVMVARQALLVLDGYVRPKIGNGA